MNDRQLYYFIVTAEEKNLGRAAERLPLSLSALSRQMQALEEEFGVPLFNRTLAGFELTHAGETLLKHARSLRSQIELAKNEVQRANTRVQGRLDFGCAGTAIFSYVPQILKEFTKNYPNVDVVLHTAATAQQVEHLYQGRTLMFFDRFFHCQTELSVETAFKDNMLLALPENHPMASHAEIDFKQLRDEPFISSDVEKNKSPEVWEMQEHYGFQLKVVQWVHDMIAAVAMVGGGFGVAIVPASLRNLKIPNVTYRPLVGVREFPCDICCVYRKSEASPILRAMLKTVREFADKHQKSHVSD